MIHQLESLVRRPWVWALAAVPVAYAGMPASFDLDDAYISLHSARVLLSGHDAAYGSTALVGVTSPPHVALLALLSALHLPAGTVAGALGLLAFVAGVWALGRTLALSPLRAAAAAGLVLASGVVLILARNGLETGWAFAAVVWLLVFVLRGERVRAALLAGLLPAIRPDLAPTAGLVFLYVLWPLSWRERGRLVAFAAVVAAPWFLWVRLDTGAWVPQTIRAKEYWFAEGCLPLADQWRLGFGGLKQVSWQLLPLVVTLPLLWRSPLGRVGLLAMVVTLTAYLLFLPGGLYHNDHRYAYVIVLPWLCLACTTLLASDIAGRPAIFAVLVAGMALYGAQTTKWPHAIAAEGGKARELAAVGQWVDQHLPADAVVLVHDAGAISETTRQHLVDLVGLKTPSSIDAHAQFTWPTCGRDRAQALALIARNAHAQYLVVLRDWGRIFSIPRGLLEQGFALAPLRASPPGVHGYEVYALYDRANATAENSR